MRPSPVQRIAYVEEKYTHERGGRRGGAGLMFDHCAFEKPSSTSNVDAPTFNELGWWLREEKQKLGDVGLVWLLQGA